MVVPFMNRQAKPLDKDKIDGAVLCKSHFEEENANHTLEAVCQV